MGHRSYFNYSSIFYSEFPPRRMVSPATSYYIVKNNNGIINGEMLRHYYLIFILMVGSLYKKLFFLMATIFGQQKRSNYWGSSQIFDFLPEFLPEILYLFFEEGKRGFQKMYVWSKYLDWVLDSDQNPSTGSRISCF